MSVRLVVVGSGFRFGHRAGGGVGTIRELSSVAGIDGVEVGTVEVAGGSVSSTRVRAALRDGDVQLAAMLLGRHFEATGLRHALGPSTERFVVPVHRAVPAPGRYAGRVSTDGMSSGAPAVVEVAAHEGRPLLTIEYCGGCRMSLRDVPVSPSTSRCDRCDCLGWPFAGHPGDCASGGLGALMSNITPSMRMAKQAAAATTAEATP